MNLINNKLIKLKDIMLDAFYPQRCVICNCFVNIGSTYSICTDCRCTLSKYGKVVRDNEKYFEETVCALPYKGHIKSAMTDYKFNNIRYLYKSFSYAIFQKIKDRDFLKETSLICPVPIHPKRDRLYNQSALMARHLSYLTGIEFCEDILIKLRNTKPLSKLGYKKRRHYAKTAVAFNIQYNIEDKIICLIDDIYTTGSTANECARILRIYGAKKVYILSACYAEDKK